MAIGIPGRTGSTRHTELGALNEIIKRLTDLKNTVTISAGGDASLAEQQLQTAELIDINNNTFLAITTNAPSHIELTNPANEDFVTFKELSFVCSGTISVILDGNTIIYPYTLGAATILGATLKADVSSTNTVRFNGTGTVLITIQQ